MILNYSTEFPDILFYIDDFLNTCLNHLVVYALTLILQLVCFWSISLDKCGLLLLVCLISGKWLDLQYIKVCNCHVSISIRYSFKAAIVLIVVSCCFLIVGPTFSCCMSYNSCNSRRSVEWRGYSMGKVNRSYEVMWDLIQLFILNHISKHQVCIWYNLAPPLIFLFCRVRSDKAPSAIVFLLGHSAIALTTLFETYKNSFLLEKWSFLLRNLTMGLWNSWLFFHWQTFKFCT